jgi:uridylate kinase
MKLVISLGGSLLTRKLTSENFKKYADVLKKLKKNGHKLVVVCGGGKVCRQYRNIAKKFKPKNELLDWIGIQATHMNALTLISALGKDAYDNSLRTVDEVRKNFGNKILVCGGNLPGHSTDYDAALFAQAIKADLLINATDVDGVYSSDPKKDPEAKKFNKLSYNEFEKIMLKNPQTPGEYRFFDIKATRLIKKAKIKTIFINGNDPEEIIRAVSGKHQGTTIG